MNPLTDIQATLAEDDETLFVADVSAEEGRRYALDMLARAGLPATAWEPDDTDEPL